jgi:hypothetical protein
VHVYELCPFVLNLVTYYFSALILVCHLNYVMGYIRGRELSWWFSHFAFVSKDLLWPLNAQST